jgi:hypothetical protein
MLSRSRSNLAAGAGVRVTRRDDRSRANHHDAAGETSGKTSGLSSTFRRRPPIPVKKRATAESARRVESHRHADLVERDYELQDVLDVLAARLQAIEHITTREHDDRLSVIEADAAPYALAFFLEIQRLDAAVIGRRRRRVR